MGDSISSRSFFFFFLFFNSFDWALLINLESLTIIESYDGPKLSLITLPLFLNRCEASSSAVILYFFLFCGTADLTVWFPPYTSLQMLVLKADEPNRNIPPSFCSLYSWSDGDLSWARQSASSPALSISYELCTFLLSFDFNAFAFLFLDGCCPGLLIYGLIISFSFFNFSFNLWFASSIFLFYI